MSTSKGEFTPANGFRDDQLVKVPIPPKLEIGSKARNPAYDIPQYELKTFASYKAERNHRLHKEWYEQHKRADALIVNQIGTPLYALYRSPEGDHDEMVGQFFKQVLEDNPTPLPGKDK